MVPFVDWTTGADIKPPTCVVSTGELRAKRYIVIKQRKLYPIKLKN